MICIQQSSCYNLLFLGIIWYVVATDRTTRTTADTDEVTLNLSGKDNGIGYMNVRQNRKKYLHEMFVCDFLVTKVLRDVPFCTKVMGIFSAYVPRV